MTRKAGRPTVSFTLMTETVEQIEKRKGAAYPNRSAALETMIERYAAIMDEERRQLRKKFTDQEAALILDATNSTLFDALSAKSFADEIEDAITDEHLDMKWGVDRNELIKKLSGLSYSEKIALVDMKERWWERNTVTESVEFGEFFK